MYHLSHKEREREGVCVCECVRLFLSLLFSLSLSPLSLTHLAGKQCNFMGGFAGEFCVVLYGTPAAKSEFEKTRT